MSNPGKATGLAQSQGHPVGPRRLDPGGRAGGEFARAHSNHRRVGHRPRRRWFLGPGRWEVQIAEPGPPNLSGQGSSILGPILFSRPLTTRSKAVAEAVHVAALPHNAGYGIRAINVETGEDVCIRSLKAALSERVKPFVLFGRDTPRARVYSIGPEHLDWLCVFCGRTGGLEGHRHARRALVDAQVSIRRMAEEDPRSVRRRVESLGWCLAERRARRSALEHLRGHLRFEMVDSKQG